MIDSHFYTVIASPLGEIVLTSNGDALTGLYLPENSNYTTAKNGQHNLKFFQNAIKQLQEYFEGKRKIFDLPLAPAGTKFQQRVWQALQNIGYGKTVTYSDIAKSLNEPNSSRAVGTANGKNPICIIVPCHRVLSASGKLSGYNGGVAVKKWLLEHEASAIDSLELVL